MPEEKKTSKLKRYILIFIIIAVFAFAIITSIVLNSYRKDLEKLENDNEQVLPENNQSLCLNLDNSNEKYFIEHFCF